MDSSAEAPPPAEEIAPVFDAYEVRRDEDTVLYVGEPTIPGQQLERELWPLFRERGYELSIQRGYRTSEGIPLSRGEYVLVAEPNSVELDGIPSTNLFLFVATVFSTMFAGAYFWYQVPLFSEPWRAIEAWPFVVAVLGVLGVHELGHYVMSRYHNVQASLPYFIPLPTYIGSMGAVIKMKGKIPDRNALFDIGAAGPLAGLAATVVVTAIGLQLDPLPAQEAAVAQAETGVRFNRPPLLQLIALATGATGQLDANTIHPVVFGGWVGMLVTLLNMLPVGQLDGGHILRAMVGEQQERIAALVPAVLFGLAGYLLVVADGIDSVGIWAMWGLFAVGLAYAGPADPIDDEPLDRKRMALGIVTFALAALCFTPIPVEIVELA
ncbi:MAG: membrane-associated protease RseP (regulator of RpoE activity) [Natronomonas sp.]|jgi:membrane-associated protease RseP (regulator of RpoE activity)